jgi:hypothetical protein
VASCHQSFLIQLFLKSCEYEPSLRSPKKLKVWCHYATLFDIHYYLTIIHTVQSYIHSSFTIRRGPPSYISSISAREEPPAWGAEPRIELGPALQQADAPLPTELCRIPEPCRALEPRRTLEPCRTLEPFCIPRTMPHP